MSNLDYMKIFDAAASSLNASAHINVEALDLNKYSAEISLQNAAVIKFTAVLDEYSLELFCTKDSLKYKDYARFLSRFEYNLEQMFLKNVRIESHETTKDYKIKISF